MPSRMKDSDDYLTARAANPRTGLISPSVCSPRGEPRTPGSPGEALALRIKAKAGKAGGEGDGSPGARPVLRRANEGRKISGGGDPVPWRVGHGVGAAASPKLTGVHAEAQPPACTGGAEPEEEDKFIVKMPSAQEPQPYAFPGYSAKEIEAFEHYREKARRVSSEGYDKRILVGGRKASGGEGRGQPVRAFSGESIGAGRSAIPAPLPNRDVTVLKRRARRRDPVDEDYHLEEGGVDHALAVGDEISAANFAPFSSPKTPSKRSNRHGPAPATSMATFESSATHDEVLRQNHTAIPRKSVPGQQAKAGLRDLLPRVNLVPPAAAALPRARAPGRHEGARACSLGCTKGPSSDSCLASSSTGADGRVPLFDDDPPPPTSNVQAQSQQHHDSEQMALHLLAALTSLLVEGAMAAYHALSQLRPFLPTFAIPALEPLHSRSAAPDEKAEALRTVLSTVGWIIGWLVAGAVVLRLWGLVAWMLEVVFWPLSLGWRIGRWIVFGS